MASSQARVFRCIFLPPGRLELTLQSTTAVGGVRIDSRTCLIMDEVDGMSAGDRGGVGALNALLKKTRVSELLSAGR